MAGDLLSFSCYSSQDRQCQVLLSQIIRASQYVDLAGVRHSVSVSDIVGAAVDPLGECLFDSFFKFFTLTWFCLFALVIAPLHIALLEGVNQSETKRRALVLFCAAHLQLQVEVLIDKF